jgi:hypothetical protein
MQQPELEVMKNWRLSLLTRRSSSAGASKMLSTELAKARMARRSYLLMLGTMCFLSVLGA